MSEYDWQLSAGAPLCQVSDAFYRTVRDTIFRQLTTVTTPEQYQAALESLIRLREELAQDVHRCLDHLFKEARARLRGLEIMQPAPKPPPPPPAPSPQPLSDEDLMERLKDYVTDRTKETFFGQDQAEEDEPKEGSS
jgi:hypothetical protein